MSPTTIMPYPFAGMILLQILDRQTDRQKATHKNPLCMSTGGLKTRKLMSLL